MKKIYDKNNTLIKDGDIVDVFDTICGETFVCCKNSR